MSLIHEKVWFGFEISGEDGPWWTCEARYFRSSTTLWPCGGVSTCDHVCSGLARLRYVSQNPKFPPTSSFLCDVNFRE